MENGSRGLTGRVNRFGLSDYVKFYVHFRLTLIDEYEFGIVLLLLLSNFFFFMENNVCL
jgi:hypothetical protein